MDAPPGIETQPLANELTGILERSPAVVALVAGSPIDLAAGSGIFVPFGGGEHEWAALELGAWLASVAAVPLTLVGTHHDPGHARRDASRLLADASLAVQRVVGVATDAAPRRGEQRVARRRGRGCERCRRRGSRRAGVGRESALPGVRSSAAPTCLSCSYTGACDRVALLRSRVARDSAGRSRRADYGVHCGVWLPVTKPANGRSPKLSSAPGALPLKRPTAGIYFPGTGWRGFESSPETGKSRFLPTS